MLGKDQSIINLDNEAFSYLNYSEKFIPSDYDSALIYTLLAADCFHENENYTMYLRCILATVNMEMIFKNFSKLESKYKWFYDEVLPLYNPSRDLLATLLNTNSYYQKIIGNYNDAITLQIEALSLLENVPQNYFRLGVYHRNLAILHFRKNDFFRSKKELEISLNFLKKINPNELKFSSIYSVNYHDLGKVFFHLGIINKGVEFFNVSQSSFGFEKGSFKKLELQNDFISIYLSNELCDRAKENMEEIDTKYLKSDFDSLVYLINKCGINNCFGITNTEASIQVLWNLVSSIENPVEKELKTIDVLKIELNELILSNNFTVESILNFNERCLSILDKTNWNQNEKLEFLLSKLEFQKNIPDYDSSPDIRLARKYFNLVSKQIQSEESKFILGEKSRGLQQLLLSDFDVEKKYFEDYLEILEMNKSSVLFDQIYKDETQDNFIAEDLLLKEEKARRFLIFLEKELATSESKFESNKNTHDSLILNNLKLQISKASNEYDIIKHEIAEKYPEYNDYVLEESFFETSEIQASLKPDEVLLETVFTDDFCLLAFFSNTNTHTLKIEGQDYTKCKNLLEQISQGSYRQDNQSEILVELSSLFGLDTSNILEEKSRIIIVPDGPLYNLPFELLSKNGNLLLEDYSISYQYSYKLLMILKKHSESITRQSPFLGVSFPTNEAIASSERVCDELELSKLSCAKNEIANIENILQLDNTKSDITVDEFILASKDARIIHIASHACPDEENHQLSRIHFKDDFLTNYDISAMRLNSDLAVLSACETGYGKVVAGEGAMTIARAFFQAGVNTNIVSLWKVDDCSTAELMNYFYQHLYNGEDSDVALQNAKLDFLEKSHPQYHDPYYWAGFIHMGHTSPIFPKSNSAKYLVFAFIGLIAVSFGFKGYQSILRRAA